MVLDLDSWFFTRWPSPGTHHNYLGVTKSLLSKLMLQGMCCFSLMHTSTCTPLAIHCTSQTFNPDVVIANCIIHIFLPNNLLNNNNFILKCHQTSKMPLSKFRAYKLLSGDTILWSLNSYPNIYQVFLQAFMNMTNKSSFNWHFWLDKKFCVPGAKTLGPRLLYAVLINTKNAFNNNSMNRTNNKQADS